MNKDYRECMAEIMGVLKRYDMAGAVTVVSKERCMFKYHFPTWTVVSLVPSPTAMGLEGIRLKSKRADFPSAEAQHKANELSAHCIMQMRDVAVNTLGLCNLAGEKMKQAWGMQHKPHADFDPELDQ